MTWTQDEHTYPPAATSAAARCSFQLAYHRATKTRLIWPGYLGGEEIDASDVPDAKVDGGWEGAAYQVPSSDDEQAWIDHYASLALNEAIHEALEWFQVDGRPWLNPHGPAEHVIYELIEQLCVELSNVRRQMPNVDSLGWGDDPGTEVKVARAARIARWRPAIEEVMRLALSDPFNSDAAGTPTEVEKTFRDITDPLEGQR